jgi:transposase-like protein
VRKWICPELFYSRDLKVAAMRALDTGSTNAEIARKYQVSPHLLERWRGEWRAKGDLAFPGIGRRGVSLPAVDDARRLGELERKDWPTHHGERFLKKSLTAFQGSSPTGRRQWRGCLFEEIRQAAAKGQAVNALCQMTGLNRAGFYRWRVPRPAVPAEMEIRDQLQKVALESPAYGYRRITHELRHRGFDINHKRVLRMMREDNLLCVRRRAFVVTTDSRHHAPTCAWSGTSSTILLGIARHMRMFPPWNLLNIHERHFHSCFHATTSQEN